jgi:hypothetical protein
MTSTLTTTERVSDEVVEDWIIKSYLYIEITEGEDHQYWCGFNDALRTVMGRAEGLE